MRVFIDTNVLLSAALFPDGAAARAYYKAVTVPYDPLVSDYVIEELKCVFLRKFPQSLQALDAFISLLRASVQIVQTPTDPVDDENKIRDIKDRPFFVQRSQRGQISSSQVIRICLSIPLRDRK
ncbi:MAG: PIN domain-containing protein [Atopobiaceae bacterium]|nr:PIN domain-containing protein [Atopobiaceae bacterium]